MDINIDIDVTIDNKFNEQMNFVRERNKIKYEIKMMTEQDVYSQNIQHMFRTQREIELQKKKKDEEIKLQQIILQEQLDNELRELNIFIEEYITNKLIRMNNNDNIDFEFLRNEAENLFYNRLLKKQQDEEYNKTVSQDKMKMYSK
jgi:hypothetical protein